MIAAYPDPGVVARLAGMANVLSALLAAMPILDPATRPDALQTCASMADDVARDLATLIGSHS